MSKDFVACMACGWEGVDVDTCPDCGSATKNLGIVIDGVVTADDLADLDEADADED